MNIDLSALEQRYGQMSEVEFDLIRWADLTEGARSFYEQELRRRRRSDAEQLISRWREQYEDEIADEKKNMVANPPWFSLSGRLSRSRYAVRVVSAGFLLGIVANVIVFLLVRVQGEEALAVVPFVQAALFFTDMAVAVPQAIKRLHDLDRPGSRAWLLLIPLYGLYLGIVLLVKKGTSGLNRYGDDPLLCQRL